jgi:hypothetical protein
VTTATSIGILFPSASKEKSGELPCIYSALMAHGLTYNLDYKTFDRSTDVAVTTIHSSKGAEWDHVIVAGIQSSRFPFSSVTNEIARNTFYVALTRARKTCEFVGWREHRANSLCHFITEMPGFFEGIGAPPKVAPTIELVFRRFSVEHVTDDWENVGVRREAVRYEFSPGPADFPRTELGQCEPLLLSRLAAIMLKRKLVADYVPMSYKYYIANKIIMLPLPELARMQNLRVLHKIGDVMYELDRRLAMKLGCAHHFVGHDISSGIVCCASNSGFNDITDAVDRILRGNVNCPDTLFEIAKLDYYLSCKYGYMRAFKISRAQFDSIDAKCARVAAELVRRCPAGFRLDVPCSSKFFSGTVDLVGKTRGELPALFCLRWFKERNDFISPKKNIFQLAIYKSLMEAEDANLVNIFDGSQLKVTNRLSLEPIEDYILAKIVIMALNRKNQLTNTRTMGANNFVTSVDEAGNIASISVNDPIRRICTASFEEWRNFCAPFPDTPVRIETSERALLVLCRNPIPENWVLEVKYPEEFPDELTVFPSMHNLLFDWCYRAIRS